MEVVTMTSNMLGELKCYVCSHHLSHFPIRVSPEGNNLCHRCSHATLGPTAPNKAYETLARYMKFPCIYSTEGCLEKFVPVDIPTHEAECSYQLDGCPVNYFTACPARIPRNSTLQHCQGEHSELFLTKGTFQVNRSASYQCENLFEHSSQLFYVKHSFSADNNTLEFFMHKIWRDPTAEEQRWMLSFTTKTRGLKITLSDQPIMVPLACLIEEEGSLVVTGRITSKKEELGTPRVNYRTLAEFKCAHCQEYVLPPMYSNAEKMSCFACISEKQSQRGNGFIPIHSSPYTNALERPTPLPGFTRNLHVERIAHTLNYPCKYFSQGCDFVGKPKDMPNHLESCVHAVHICPLSDYTVCHWTGLGTQIKDHVLDCHEQQDLISDMLELSISVCYPTTTPETATHEKFFVVVFMGHVFCLHFVVSSHHYTWTVEILDQFQPGFMFEIEVLDANKKRAGYSSKQECVSRRSGTCTDGCYFTKNQIKPLLLSERLIRFRLRMLMVH